MSVIFALECGGEKLSAAMNIDGAITVCVAANPYLDSAEALLGELLEKTAHPLESCDAFALARDPGAFRACVLACG